MMTADPPFPRSPKSRIAPEPWGDGDLESETDAVEPGYEEAGDPDANLVDADRSDVAMYLCMGHLPRKSAKSRFRRRPWPDGQTVEPPPGKVLEPGDSGYDDAVDDPERNLTDAHA